MGMWSVWGRKWECVARTGSKIDDTCLRNEYVDRIQNMDTSTGSKKLDMSTRSKLITLVSKMDMSTGSKKWVVEPDPQLKTLISSLNNNTFSGFPSASLLSFLPSHRDSSCAHPLIYEGGATRGGGYIPLTM
jgi:hypothetical protein